jgi:DNA polymerase-3 subunit gamma/tau
MAYQVLARKWRPRSFETLVGQEHVVRALTHALSTGRLHHAYLFTGTRGVGKTTISRILAKALNCETGVTPTPCNQCAACTAIDADRFPTTSRWTPPPTAASTTWPRCSTRRCMRRCRAATRST